MRKLGEVEPITTVIRIGRLRWYGRLMRKSDEDWVKKRMEFRRVEDRRQVGRPRTWLESEEANMAELEKMYMTERKKKECYKEEVQPHQKRTINR